MTTNCARCTHGIKSRTAMAKAAFHKKQTLFASKLDLNLRNKPMMCYIWSTAFYTAEKWTLWKVDKKCLESCETQCWRKMEWNILQTINRRKANYTGHILHSNCLLKHVIQER
jgi:hypothetical protein